ncbi:MAG: adenylosuccinate lyase [Marine Group III euryarchaeote CG-Epi3]|uniref:Adenylosuccinate lyase n=1 Tax=Marine Group III euryarchaeote CG-Epi3 TaxID=1888997 RepID=A0A1J5TQ61_9ARCH|nr:MAG: adenylosuccinate lyase [Marine Group III euryarchaeote CG-Epi3]
MDPVSVLDYRYGTEEMRDVFRANSYLNFLLEVEATLAEAQSDIGIIPKEAAKEIRKGLKLVKRERVEEIEAEINHDVMAVVKGLEEKVGNAGKWIHFGATSYDIVDTARALQHKRAIDLIETALQKLLISMSKLAGKHKDTVMLGRTHGQWATPITFGLKMAVFTSELARHIDRLAELKPRIMTGKFLGAVGSGAAMHPHTLKVQSLVCEKLGLNEPLATTQILGRDRISEVIAWGANLATSIEKFTIEVRNLQRSDIGEVAEAFNVEKQVGSSTMAQKKNPITSENVGGLARVIRSVLYSSYENNLQWHERDLANSSNERIILPQFYILLEYIIKKTENIFSNLYVNKDKMKLNLDQAGGLPMAEAFVIALGKTDLGRQDAHELVRSITMEAEKKGVTFSQNVKNNNEVQKYLSEEEILYCLEPNNYVGHSNEIIDKVLASINE